MADGIDDGTRTPLRHHPLVRTGTSVLRYGVYVAFLALIVAEIGLDASTWLSVQMVAGLLGGVLIVGALWLVADRTALGRSADEAFQRRRLVVSLLIVALVTLGGIAVSSAFEGIPRLFFLAVALGLFGGLVALEGAADYRQ